MAKTCWFTPGARQNHTGKCVFLTSDSTRVFGTL